MEMFFFSNRSNYQSVPVIKVPIIEGRLYSSEANNTALMTICTGIFSSRIETPESSPSRVPLIPLINMKSETRNQGKVEIHLEDGEEGKETLPARRQHTFPDISPASSATVSSSVSSRSLYR